MKNSISLKELISIVIRRGRVIVVIALTFAIIAGVYKAVNLDAGSQNNSSAQSNSLNSVDEEYQKMVAQYELQKASLETSITGARNRYVHLMEYQKISQIMKIDPYHVWVARISLMVTPDVELPDKDVLDYRIVDFDEMAERIANRYLVMWNGILLQDNLPNYSYSNIDDKYIRELVKIESYGNGMLSIEAIGANENDAKALANDVARLIETAKEEVSNFTYPHDLKISQLSLNMIVDEEIERRQNSVIERTSDTTKQISTLDSQIKALKMPARDDVATSASGILKSSVKYACLGLLLGLLAGVLLVIVQILFSDRYEISSHLGEALSAPFLGSVKMNQSVWEKCSDKYLGEKTNQNRDDKERFIKETTQVFLKGNNTIALVSTLNANKNDSEIQTILNAMRAGGKKVEFSANAADSVEGISAIQNCDSVVLLEKPGKSSWKKIESIADLAKAADKQISGYIVF